MELTYENGAAIRDKMMTNSASVVVSAWYDQYGTDILRLCFMYLRNGLSSGVADSIALRFISVSALAYTSVVSS